MSRLKNQNVAHLSSSNHNNNRKEKITELNTIPFLLDTNKFNNNNKKNIDGNWNFAELPSEIKEYPMNFQFTFDRHNFTEHTSDSSEKPSSQLLSSVLVGNEDKQNKSSAYITSSYSYNANKSQVDIAENNKPNVDTKNEIFIQDAYNSEKKSKGKGLNEDEVESKNNEGGEIFEEETLTETNSSENTSHHAISFSSCNVTTIQTTESSQQINLKPILKRKDSTEIRNQSLQTISILPPILKKRDIIHNDNNVSQKQSTNIIGGNALNQPKPLSILKNRQTKGSYSFDDNIGPSDILSPSDDHSSTSSIYHLKPILKKKSWSTEDKVLTGLIGSSSSEGVKGILKSSNNKSTSSSSVSSKNSILDDSGTDSQHINSKSPKVITHNSNNTVLKSILKSSLKNRSTSLSPCTSTDSLNDYIKSEDRLLYGNNPKSAFRKRTSLDNDTSTSIQLLDYYEELKQPTNIDDNSQISVINNINIKPILKRNSIDSPHCVDFSTVGIKVNQSSTLTTIINQEDINLSTEMEQNKSDENTKKEELRMSSSSNVTLRNNNNNNTNTNNNNNNNNNEVKVRPKSCFIHSSEINNSIQERLAALKQNGEQAWKNRIQKEEIKEDSLSNNINNVNIANRLSSLFESQSQWRNRVPEKDAKQFTVASKWNQTNQNKSVDKVVLRETSKRSGLRGSSLSEKKLGAISSKLNNVLSADKNPFSLPTKIKKECDDNEECKEEKEKEILTNKQPEAISILKPDDEESFGSFFGLNESTLEQILNQTLNGSNISMFDSIEESSSSIKLLPKNKKTRIKAPKRRAASERNPVKLLARSQITVDSYQTVQKSTTATASISNTKNTSTKDDSKFAISALAGLASTEDFKSVANSLRNSSLNSNLTYNDIWRNYDLKNSLQNKMLILVKGRRKAHTRLVEPNWDSLNQVDSFILVTKDNIFAYIGQFSNIIERTKCIEISELIRKRKDLCFRSQTSGITLIDCQNSGQFSLYEKLLPMLKELNFIESDRQNFEKKFNQSITTYDIDLDEDDELYEESITYSNMVYKVIEDERSDSNKVYLKPIESYCGRSPRHQVLQQDNALVFDYGSEMYIWLGKQISNILRKKAIEVAKDLWLQGYDYSEYEYNPFGEKNPIKCDKRPDWSWFIRVNHNMEPILFKDKFFNWPAFTLIRSEKKVSQKNNISEKKEHKVVKKDLSAELNLFPVDVEKDMIKKIPKEPEINLEGVPLGRGAGDTIKDEDGLSVKVISLDMQCFYIDEFGDRVELEAEDRNFLCSGESYYIRWKYRLTRISRNLKTGGESRFSEQHGGRDRICYFVWQGKDAKNTKKGLTALNAIEKLREEGASQIYVEHGYEDPVFLRMFQGSLVIQTGKRNQITSCKKYRMFMLNDTVPSEEFMVELECSFKNLRSRMSYVFINPDNSKEIYIWHGVKTNENKRKSIKKFVEDKLLNYKSKEFGFTNKQFEYEILELDEGHESKTFMEIFYSLNQTSPDSTLKRSSKSNLHRDIYFSLMDDSRLYDFTPRLFHFITSSDQIFEALEIVPSYFPSKTSNIIVNYPFVQDDLYERAKSRPTFFLFDAGYEVFLWESKYPFFIYKNDERKIEQEENVPPMIDIANEIQSESNTTIGFMNQLWLAERKCALETTLAYCHAKNSSEPSKSYVISAGLEPDAFCGLFPTWNYYDNVAKLHIQDGRKPGEQILVQEILSQIEDINQSTYSYQELKRRPLPEGINILCLESYLDDEEFEKVFSMNREEFYSLPTWKQKIIKQEKELF